MLEIIMNTSRQDFLFRYYGRKCSKKLLLEIPTSPEIAENMGILGTYSPSRPAVKMLCWGGELFYSPDYHHQHSATAP